MTKVVKWYQKYNTWTTIMAILAPMAGGELVAAFTNFPLPVWVHGAVGICAFTLLVLKAVVKDVDGNGIVDIFQKKINNGKINRVLPEKQESEGEKTEG